MTVDMSSITAEIEKLSPTEQAKLAADILARLHGGSVQIENAWAEEAMKRLEEIRRGEASTFDAAEVMEEARQRLRRRR